MALTGTLNFNCFSHVLLNIIKGYLHNIVLVDRNKTLHLPQVTIMTGNAP